MSPVQSSYISWVVVLRVAFFIFIWMDRSVGSAIQGRRLSVCLIVSNLLIYRYNVRGCLPQFLGDRRFMDVCNISLVAGPNHRLHLGTVHYIDSLHGYRPWRGRDRSLGFRWWSLHCGWIVCKRHKNFVVGCGRRWVG